jgi:hypothetical protein
MNKIQDQAGGPVFPSTRAGCREVSVGVSAGVMAALFVKHFIN